MLGSKVNHAKAKYDTMNKKEKTLNREMRHEELVAID